MKLQWSSKLFDDLHFFKMSKEKKMIGWDIFYKYRVIYTYSMNLGVCLYVKRKHIQRINTFFSFFIKYKYLRIYLGLLYFLNGMIIDIEKYRIFNKYFRYSKLSRIRLFKKNKY